MKRIIYYIDIIVRARKVTFSSPLVMMRVFYEK